MYNVVHIKCVEAALSWINVTVTAGEEDKQKKDSSTLGWCICCAGIIAFKLKIDT